MTDKLTEVIEAHEGCLCGWNGPEEEWAAHMAEAIRAAGETRTVYRVVMDRDDGELAYFIAANRRQAFDVAASERREGFHAKVEAKTTTSITGDWEPIELPTIMEGTGDV